MVCARACTTCDVMRLISTDYDIVILSQILTVKRVLFLLNSYTIYPVAALGFNYMTMTYFPGSTDDQGKSQIGVIATQDNTVVRYSTS